MYYYLAFDFFVYINPQNPILKTLKNKVKETKKQALKKPNGKPKPEHKKEVKKGIIGEDSKMKKRKREQTTTKEKTGKKGGEMRREFWRLLFYGWH